MTATTLLSDATALPNTTAKSSASKFSPSVDLLLTVDAMYRERAAADTLQKIAPTRLNRSKLAWLPIMHASHDKWQFTARYSNTLRANQLGKTSDWVVITFRYDHHFVGHATVVTETHGPREGERVVRGHETE